MRAVLGLALALSVVLMSPVKATAVELRTMTAVQQDTTARAKRRLYVQQRQNWRRLMARSQRPKKGCFAATYPSKKWREVTCKTPPNRPYPPRSGVRPQTVGNGVDYSGEVTNNTTQAEGSFDSVNGVTSENDNGTANMFSLQLNTNFFSTSSCSGAVNPAACQGWEQFIYSSLYGGVFIQYWMLNYGPTCPAGWWAYGGHCYTNSVNGTTLPAQSIAALGQMVLDGAVSGVNGTDDFVTLAIGANVYTATGDNNFPDLTNGWRISEYNVFGDGNGSGATFNTGSTIVVRTAVNSGTPALDATCSLQGFTGETNNLTLVGAPTTFPDVLWPSIVFTESNAAGGTAASCAGADSYGDTHLKTFDGLMYDFQASGDFVLVQDGPDFAVHALQASGAPTWPNTSVNKGVATQMGHSHVVIYIEPTRLIIDGQAQNLPDGQTIFLTDSVQVFRQGNSYIVTSASGNSVRADLNSSWINITVGLGHTPAVQAVGLLGRPGASANQLVMANGTVLKEPVSFTDLYHGYADGWRAQGFDSLFTQNITIKVGIPDTVFYARQLTQTQYARARATCRRAGVKTQALLDACTLDAVVLADNDAVKPYLRIPRPTRVVKPVVRVIR